MPGTMPPRRKITLVRWDGRTVRLVEMRQCILFWPQVGVTRDGALRSSLRAFFTGTLAK
jgi:hypothetical protein